MTTKTDAINIETKRRMQIMLIGVTVVFGIIFLYKIITGMIFNFLMNHRSHIVTVSTIKVSTTPWQPQITAVGSTRAVFKGVNVTTELAGMVRDIYFTPGQFVKQGTLLVQLNDATEQGQLAALKASAALALITFKRDTAQFAVSAVSKQTLDNDEGNLKNLNGQVVASAATAAKKAIRAPFSGQLGVAYVNYGQYLNPGDKVASLQQLDPIWVDFTVPQEQAPELSLNLPVQIKVDGIKEKTYNGRITAIDPAVDQNTRNVTVEATILNSNLQLRPGMFTRVVVNTGKPVTYLTIPQAAISYNPYGDIVYIVKHTHRHFRKDILTVEQSFVITGETRGDQITILKGLKINDEIVTAGQLKLKNNTQVEINNSIVPSDSPNPIIANGNGG